MFRLSRQEIARISQSVTSLSGLKFSKQVHAFTEEGVAMLSSVLNSERAVQVNIAIMRAFVPLREMLETNRELARKFAELEARVGKHDEEIGSIIEAIRQLMFPPEKPKREIGFHVREKATREYGVRKRNLHIACAVVFGTPEPRHRRLISALIIRCSMLGVGRFLLPNITLHPS
jgi:hypothetical protein